MADVDTRITLLARAKDFGQMIAEAERDLWRTRGLRQTGTRKMAILKNIAYQMRRYTARVLALKDDNPDDAPYIRTIILSLGVRPSSA